MSQAPARGGKERGRVVKAQGEGRGGRDGRPRKQGEGGRASRLGSKMGGHAGNMGTESPLTEAGESLGILGMPRQG